MHNFVYFLHFHSKPGAKRKKRNFFLFTLEAIEADRSTEFKVLCSKEQVARTKERKRQESEQQKKRRAQEEETRRKSKDKVVLQILEVTLIIARSRQSIQRNVPSLKRLKNCRLCVGNSQTAVVRAVPLHSQNCNRRLVVQAQRYFFVYFKSCLNNLRI